MSLADLIYAAGAVVVSLGGGALVVGFLAKWLGDLWAQRVLEREREAGQRDREMLIRRREVYRKLATTLRVFVGSPKPATDAMKLAFLEAYDEAALWASESVIAEVGKLLDMLVTHTAAPGSMSQEALKSEYAHCITVMRMDSGFPNTPYRHRVVSF